MGFSNFKNAPKSKYKHNLPSKKKPQPDFHTRYLSSHFEFSAANTVAGEPMALNDPPGSETGSDPEDLEALEREAKEMAQKILQYRATLPDQLKNTFASALAAQRPILPDGSDPATSGAPNLDAGQVVSNRDTLLADEDQTTEKARLLKDKVSRNLAALPIVMKRMKECMSKIEKLDAQTRIIHPAFQRKKTSYP